METRSLDEIRKECEGCHKCSLAETRTNVVFGVGNPHADVMFIGEAPGEKRIYRVFRLSVRRASFLINIS